jgi:CheY-like chemotaxis protein
MREEKYHPLAIMVVDDDELGRKYLSTLLDGIGVGNALTAESGAGALRELEATDADVNLIICDVEMPEMNGFEFVRRIRYGLVPRFKDLPILLLTERATEKHLEYAHTHKISGLLEKPLTADVLKVELHHVLGV